jgi:ferrous iron transport protein A
MVKLRDLKSGESAIIQSIEDSELFLKLMEMGCVPGEQIKVEKIAPFGDPISILVSGYTLSLRLNEADAIFVERLETTSQSIENQ